MVKVDPPLVPGTLQRSRSAQFNNDKAMPSPPNAFCTLDPPLSARTASRAPAADAGGESGKEGSREGRGGGRPNPVPPPAPQRPSSLCLQGSTRTHSGLIGRCATVPAWKPLSLPPDGNPSPHPLAAAHSACPRLDQRGGSPRRHGVIGGWASSHCLPLQPGKSSRAAVFARVRHSSRFTSHLPPWRISTFNLLFRTGCKLS